MHIMYSVSGVGQTDFVFYLVCKKGDDKGHQSLGVRLTTRDDFQVSINPFYGAGREVLSGESQYERTFIPYKHLYVFITKPQS